MSTRGLLSFLELSEEQYDWEAMADIRVQGSSFLKNKDGRLDWHPSDMKTEDFKSVGRWRDWSPKKQKSFLLDAGSALRSWGYL